MDRWAVKRTAELLSSFGMVEGWEVLISVLGKETK